MTTPVHIIIGTKAQFIKMAPIAYLMERARIRYRIIDLSQHGALTAGIISDFDLTPDIRFFQPAGTNVSSYGAAIRWTARSFRKIATPAKALRSELLLTGRPSFALLHGDTLSTLIGLCLAHRLGLEIGLVEAGLSSNRLLSPFPEEAIRRYVEKHVQLLFAAHDATERLRSRMLTGRIIDTKYNTGRDAFELMAGKLEPGAMSARKPFTVLTLHRAETISRRRRLKRLVHYLLSLADKLPLVRFYVHEPTQRALRRAGLTDLVERHPNIVTSSLASYKEFVQTLLQARFILTDGGSIQEEASYLGTPCLVLRRETERSHGIGVTARLTSLNAEEDIEFLQSVPVRAFQQRSEPELLASRRVLAALGVLE
jgi:UDP-N-acetylglucosamine 2-epimerase (non-hydrolysing)